MCTELSFYFHMILFRSQYFFWSWFHTTLLHSVEVLCSAEDTLNVPLVGILSYPHFVPQFSFFCSPYAILIKVFFKLPTVVATICFSLTEIIFLSLFI